MKKHINTMTWTAIFFILMLSATSIQALELELRPRLETGTTRYAIKYAAVSITELSLPGQLSGANVVRGQREYSDDMTQIGGGVTLFMNRFFIDLSSQYAYDGSDQIRIVYSHYTEHPDDRTTYMDFDYLRRVEFDHHDHAIAVGYEVSRNLSVFAGYKWTDTGFRSTTEGTLDHFSASDNAYGQWLAHGHSVSSFTYSGPFIGVTNGWEVDSLKYLKGGLSVKLGLAFLNSRYTTDGTNTLIFVFDGDTYTDAVHSENKGDTWGFALGLGWTGSTPIKNLTYSINVDGYRYNFDNDDVFLGDTSETVLNYKAGIAYCF